MKNSTAIILILIGIGVIYTFAMPQYTRTKALRQEVGQYNNVLDNVTAIGETKSELSLQLADIPSSDVAKLKKVLPDSVDTVRLAMDLDAIGSKHGISVNTVQVGSANEDNASAIREDSGNTYERVTISFSFISTYENFRNFMDELERSARITDVRSVAFQSTDSGLYEYRISIETYWLK